MSLARAALADPEILVLDEATSSLDPGTEAVVADGTLREVGTHDELLARDGHYASLFAAWAGGQPV